MTMLSGLDEEGEFTELVDPNLPRADLVGAPAHGWPGWLVMKQDAESAGLLDPDFVRDLIAKSPEEAPVPASTEAEERLLPNGITLKGSAADIAAFIHAASERPTPADVAKAKYGAEEKRKMLASGAAMKNENGEPAYPIADEDDLKKAIHAVGRGGGSHNAIRKHIVARAKSLGKSSLIPDDWATDGSVKKAEADVPESVSKDVMDAAGDAVPLDEGVDGLDPTTVFAAPGDDTDLPGDPTDPGSPSWEGIDAATAHKWLAIAARLKNALLLLADRENLEAASADPSDAENAWDLQDAAAAVDFAIEQLAVFAAGEQAEAELGAECEEMCKALAGFDTAPLGVIEGLTAVAKSGRVLSSVNEARIREAAKGLQDVLASLPAAPAAPDQPVAKETEGAMPNHTIDMRGQRLAEGTAAAVLARPGPVAKTASPEDQARDTGPVNAGGTTGMGQPRMTGPDAALPGDGPQAALPGDTGRTVVKASLQVAVYDNRLHLAGLISPDRIVQQVAKADDGDGGKAAQVAVYDAEGNLVGVADPADITPLANAKAPNSAPDDAGGDAPAPAPAADDMQPQPPADAGTPADAVGKAAEENVTPAMPADLGSIIAKAVADALGAVTPAQDVAKQADVAAANARADALEARIAKVEETPAMPKVFTNGQVPPAEQLRGQDQGRNVGQIDVAKAMERRKDLYTAPDAQTQNTIAKSMQGEAIDALAAIHAAGPVPVQLRQGDRIPLPAA